MKTQSIDLPRRAIALIALVLFALTQAACAGIPNRVLLSKAENLQCNRYARDLPGHEPLILLDRLSLLFENECFDQVIELGRFVKKFHRDKTYSVTRETLSVVVPEDALSDYILESYERAYLSYLMAASFHALGKDEAASVELRNSYAEGKALLYNYGEDPINALLIATLWETLGSGEDARPFWKKVAESKDASEPTKSFALARWNELENSRPKKWKVLKLGSMPQFEWKTDLRGKKSGYFDISAPSRSEYACSSKTGLVEPTKPWIDKIANRYSAGYHPLLNAKSWVRLPIGVAYGTTSFVLGLGLAVGGCAAIVAATDGKASAETCRYAIQGGAALMSVSPQITDYVIAPDLRHWQRVPGSVVLTSADSVRDEVCWSKMSSL